MCVQRIEDGKIEAKRRGQPLADGDIQTACQQSCPAQAIIVWRHERSGEPACIAARQIHGAYRVLEEFNFRPSVAYLRVVRNRDAETAVEEGGASCADAGVIPPTAAGHRRQDDQRCHARHLRTDGAQTDGAVVERICRVVRRRC